MKWFNIVSLLLMILVINGCGGGGSSDTPPATTVYNTAPLDIATVFKTGQIKSYDAVGNEIFDSSIKDDGFYQKGVATSFTRNATDNTVTDNNLGLMWQDNTDVTTITKQWVTSANFTSANYNDTIGNTATTYCANLSIGVDNDWRLPTTTELMTITYKGTSNPAIHPAFVNANDIADIYWTSTSSTYDSSKAGYVLFLNGHNYSDYKNTSKYVRCVRGSLPAPVSKTLTRDNTTGTVSDDTTNLMWQDDTIVGSTGLYVSIDYCEALSLGGYNNWRLPNVHELNSITDTSQSLYKAYPVFLNTKSLSYWSSTNYDVNPTVAWTVSFNSGSIGFGSKVSGSLVYIRCDRDDI